MWKRHDSSPLRSGANQLNQPPQADRAYFNYRSGKQSEPVEKDLTSSPADEFALRANARLNRGVSCQ
jgi:hypothetical protein